MKNIRTDRTSKLPYGPSDYQRQYSIKPFRFDPSNHYRYRHGIVVNERLSRIVNLNEKSFRTTCIERWKKLTWSIKSWSDLILLCHRIWIQQLLRKHRESPIWWDLFELNGSNFIIFQIGLCQFETNSGLYKDDPPGIFSVIPIDIHQ